MHIIPLSVIKCGFIQLTATPIRICSSSVVYEVLSTEYDWPKPFSYSLLWKVVEDTLVWRFCLCMIFFQQYDGQVWWLLWWGGSRWHPRIESEQLPEEITTDASPSWWGMFPSLKCFIIIIMLSWNNWLSFVFFCIFYMLLYLKALSLTKVMTHWYSICYHIYFCF